MHELLIRKSSRLEQKSDIAPNEVYFVCLSGADLHTFSLQRLATAVQLDDHT